MERFFNTAGPCRPEAHYMLPAEPRVRGLRPLIEAGQYFVLHAPRQVGKTTSLRALAASLCAEGTYAALHTSCESGQKIVPDLEGSIQAILEALEIQAENDLAAELRPPSIDRSVAPESRVLDLLTRWAKQCPRPLVVFFDEIDALYDDALISVLRQLRIGFQNRPQGFPHAMALVGLRDVRDYKILARGDGVTLGTASPFNIKSDSLRLPNFTGAEVARLLEQHTEDTGQVFRPEVLDAVFELTRGQPWLVNALARQLIETVAPDRGFEISLEQLETAKEILIRRRDTHLDSLLDRLKEDRVRRVLEPIMAGEMPEEEVFDDDVRFVKDLGLLALGEAGLEIANPIYREIIPRALTSLVENFMPMRRASYIGAGGSLNWPALLDGFSAFWQQNAEWMLRRQPYSEAAAQLVFMAFLHRLVNGIEIEPGSLASRSAVATVDREFAVGSGRVDLLVRWPIDNQEIQHFAVELKVRRRRAVDPLASGLDQLSGYLDRLGLSSGTLVLFDLRPEAPPMAERCSRHTEEYRGRELTILRL